MMYLPILTLLALIFWGVATPGMIMRKNSSGKVAYFWLLFFASMAALWSFSPFKLEMIIIILVIGFGFLLLSGKK